jgi:hypothetical protein
MKSVNVLRFHSIHPSSGRRLPSYRNSAAGERAAK